MPDPLGTIADAPSGVMPIGESRFATRDIGLSSALCPLGFALKIEAQPIGIVIDAEKERQIVTFFHEDSTKLGDFNARHVDLWWNARAGKYTIEGYDDALTAMKRVGVERSRMINEAKQGNGYSPTKNMVLATGSLHSASILAACEIKLIGYDKSGKQWIFAKGAEVIYTLIKQGGKPKDGRPIVIGDLCIDWMLEWIRYHDWLKQLIRDPENIPMIEMRDGERVLQISKGMDEREQRKWISYL